MPKGTIDHIGLANGIDKSRQAYEVKQGKWWDSVNFRHIAGSIKQIPRLISYAKCGTANHNRVTAIRTIPTKHYSRSHILIFCGGKIFRLCQNGSTIRIGGDNSFKGGGDYSRWATVPHEDKIYFTNPYSPIAYTDGVKATKFTTNVPSARYISMFYDHLVVGDVVFNGATMPYRQMWSDLFKVGNWEPKRSNEADHFDCLESATDNDEIGGITGIARMNEILVTYTPSVIYHGTYVGLPRVLVNRQAWAGIGCDFKYGLASLETLHYFPNKRLRNFFEYSGGQPRPIGDEIADFFFSDINPDPVIQQMTWSFIDTANNEVWWVYVNLTSDFLGYGYNAAIVYNLKEKIWYRASVTDMSAFGGSGVVAKTVDELAGTTINNLTESCDAVGLGGGLAVPRLWGSRCGVVCKEGVGGENIDKFIPYLTPYLETADFQYGSISKTKETESVYIDALANAAGLNVILYKRDFLNAPDNAITYTQPGIWTNTIPEGRLSFPRVDAKIFRWKFTPVMPNFTLGPRRDCLHVEIETAKYKEEIFQFGAGFGYFYPPATGTYTVILIGAGGGGGAKPYTAMTQNVFTPSATKKWFKAANPVKYVREYDPAFGPFWFVFLVDNDGIIASNLSKKVYIPYNALYPDPNLDPGMSATVSATLYQAVIDFATSYARTIPNPLQGFIAVYFEQFNPAGATGYLFTDWVAGVKTLTAIPNPSWRIVAEYFQPDISAYSLQTRAGGGGGQYIRATCPITTNVVPRVGYHVGKAGSHILQGTGTIGALGGDTYLEDVFGDFLFVVEGGSGGGDNGGGGITNGSGGSTGAGAGTGVVVNQMTNGDNAVPEVFGVTDAKGGRAFGLDGSFTSFAKRDLKGYYYGGGGCGRKDDYRLNSTGTRGADGLLWIGCRIGPDGLAYPYGGFPGSNTEKAAMRQLSTDSINIIGTPGNINITFGVRGVVELKQYTGGTNPNALTSLNGTPAADNRSILKLTYGANSLYLNRSVGAPSNCCVSLDYTVSLVVPANILYTLTLDNIDLLQWEPRDVNGVSIDTSEGSDLHEPQWATVEVVDFVVTPVVSETLTQFTSFSELIYGAETEK